MDIEVSTACNLKCKMCKREEFDFGDELMPFDEYKAIVDGLPRGVKTISLGGYGEMMLNPKFFDMVRYAKDKDYMTETTSNGTLLPTDERILQLFESGLDSLRVSIDHMRPEHEGDVGHAFSERIQRTLKRLCELRNERECGIQLGINTVVQQGNIGEVGAIVKKADELGFDLIELIRLDTCMNNAERDLQYEKEKEVYIEIDRMPKRIEVITPLNRFAKWRRLYARDFCPFRYESAHVRLNGAVTPCAFGFATHNFGSIHEQDLREIWSSQNFKDVRKNPNNPVCRNCAIFKSGVLPRKSQLKIVSSDG